MGVSYIGWRECSLQRELGPEGFQGKLELRAYRSVIDDNVPKERRQSVRLRLSDPSGTCDLRYDDIVAALDGFESGIPDCSSCPLADGRPLGCYRHVSYPLDPAFEHLVLECFTSLFSEERSAARELAPAIAARLPEGQSRFDGATVCDALFASSTEPELVVLHARFWNELFAWLDAKIARCLRRAEPPPAALASRTLREIHQVSLLLNASIERARTEGWRVLVEA